MFVLFVLVILIFNFSCDGWAQKPLPNNLLMGFAASAYQLEGAWNEDGKGENIWDRLTHAHPDQVADGSNANVAADSYHRFSLSWSRILPTGFVDVINQPGIDYYKTFFRELRANGIEPMVTLYHWDLPQPLQDLGGWVNPHIADYFMDFADIAFKHFGDEVKLWITLNEPLNVCFDHYGGTGGAPQLDMHGVGDYLCGHTMLQAHAKAYHLYNDKYRASQNGSVGITLNGGHAGPLDPNSPSDRESAETMYQFEIGWFGHPIFSEDGDYPEVMRRQIDANSIAEGRPRSRLPVFTVEEVEYIKGTSDFFGMNHYTTELHTKAPEASGPDPSWERDAGQLTSQDPSWPGAASSWLKVVPWGLREHLKWVKNEYKNPPIYITENGFSDTGEVDDKNRINYHNSYLHVLVDTMNEEGVNVLGYTAWSLVDIFEMRRGYTERFGIYRLDVDDPARPRIAKSSVEYFKQVLTNRTLPPLETTPRFDY